MASLDYVDLPPCATRLRSAPKPTTKPTKSAQLKSSTSTDLRLAPKVFTSLPNPSPPSSPHHARQSSLSASLTSPTMSYIPQLLLSAAIPGGIPSTPSEENGQQQSPATTNPRQSLYPEKYTLLSTKDPLSLPIMSNNFRRFVAKVGPVFWVQDRVEEILLWRKGWRVTGTWMAVYAFLCFYPRMVILLPHAVVIGTILSTYPYPAAAKNGTATSAASSEPPAQPAEGSVPWQANIQAIQNLMGAYSDARDAIEPHIHHFVLSPTHFRDSDSHPSPATRPTSPYTPHILALLAVSFPFLAFVISLPSFPIRLVFLIGGLSPFVITHPWTIRMLPFLAAAAPRVFDEFELLLGRLRQYAPIRRFIKGEATPFPPVLTALQRLIDDDRLTDKCWNSEMRDVELWENERLGGEPSSPQPGLDGLPTVVHAPNTTNGWSKANLRPMERGPWTRGRDGWSGVGVGGSGGSLDVQGEVSSNLTFSLAPGWSFVETEDWRKDETGAWSGVGADEDGWVYTNDVWLGARPAPYTAGGGSVTRRRKWTRRVWYDKERAEREG
ncbi:hypothetical protein FA13DRAFT_1640431 [Coprinellus micaceus]|uniref:TECPR1-like DysF domain-containing protein n=1 Tax=Coprinellus micaceus TaxID=71717 RepID=A0A4Y7SM32_COPMI|nr:hypothetical protein FA13DRAFT_1640431 [Coprinellus micaceus]